MSKSIVLSIELKSLLDYIKEKTVVEFPIQTITLNYLVLSILDNVNSDGYVVLSKCMLNSDIIEFKEHVINEILLDTQKYIKIDDNINFADEYENIAHDIEKNEISTISSALMLEQILLKNENDGLDEYRKEYNKMLVDKAEGSNRMIQEKYITIQMEVPQCQHGHS